ncbi:MAG: mechanosensitive ion channel family protein [Acidobacteriaceae bacterium]|nr:mechanosensitive ion channel family protein [Acidobacteriaceae bacterium]
MCFEPKAVRVAVIALLALLLTSPAPALSQGFGGLISSEQKPAAPAAAVDPLKRTSPRSAIYAFLQACHAEKFDIASQYLDLHRLKGEQRIKQGPLLAQQLGQLLDRDTQFEVGHLSNDPGGRLGDGLAPDLDKLDDLDLNGQTVTLYMQRVAQGDLQVWLVSADSVARIPELAALAGESSIERKLPAPLVTTKFVGTPLWIWMALVLTALLISLLSRLLSRVVLLIAKRLTRRIKTLQENRLEALIEPLRLVVSVMVFRACMEVIGPSALLRDYLLKLMALLFIMGIASVLMRIVDIISDTAISRLSATEKALSYSVIPLFVRCAKIGIFALGIVTVLSNWGYNTNTILAGLGVGGVAIALASQKTIENLFGSVSIISDRPVLVGDFCKFGDQSGTVEDIGLRSTRIRTLDRTVVTIPNSVFSTMTLENFAKRDRMWFHPTLSLRRDTTPEKIRAMMDAVTKILKSHPMVDPTDVPLRFTKITRDSFDLDIFSYVLTPDFNAYLRVQSEVLLQIVAAAQDLGIEFAVPINENVAPTLQLRPEGEMATK